jgi:hypothetical protein
MRWKVISFVIVKRFGLLGFSSSVIKPPYLASLLLISSVRTAKGILNSGVPHSSIYVTVFYSIPGKRLYFKRDCTIRQLKI